MSTQSDTVGLPVAAPPSVKVTDTGGNPVAGVSVTFTITGGGGSIVPISTSPVVTDAGGIATLTSWTLGTATGTNTVTATAAGLAGSPVLFTATGTAGPATKLVIAQQPSTTASTGVPFLQQPAIQLQDAFSNPVPQSGTIVTAAIFSGTGTLGGTSLTASTDANGLASFADLSITGSGDHTLQFTSGGLTAATSTTITLP
ncbi:MAG: hypothetical protein R2910_10460 [Gemmatimonadales bacterium]